MPKPVAVLISDIHYNLSTLPLADAALRMAVNKASDLKVPLVVAGDLHDTKALLRAECVSAMLETFDDAFDRGVRVYVIVGNHDLQNEKGQADALAFLEGACTLVREPQGLPGVGYMIPYYSDSAKLLEVLNTKPAKTLITHTGVQSANMGHYTKDTSSLPPEAFKDFRVISGHYHMAQDITCGPPRKGAVGLFSYIGNPYTLNFGEAKDPAKGFCVLMDDGTLERIPTNLRKHVVIEMTSNDFVQANLSGHRLDPDTQTGDLVWIKVTGPRSELDGLNKARVAHILGLDSFKLDKIYTDAPALEQKSDKMTGEEVLDSLIDNTSDTAQHKKALKSLWREIL